LDVFRLGNVGLHGNSVAARLLDFLSHLLCTRLVVDIIHNDVRSFRPSFSAIAAPIPFDAPVITATLPFSLAISRPFPRNVELKIQTLIRQFDNHLSRGGTQRKGFRILLSYNLPSWDRYFCQTLRRNFM